jgi:hypothetical protein
MRLIKPLDMCKAIDPSPLKQAPQFHIVLE